MRSSACAGAAWAALLCAGAAVAGEAAKPADELVELINEFRGRAHTCEGRKIEATGPLAPDERLARVELTRASGALTDALRDAGYAAARAQVVALSGPRTPRAVMDMLVARYCRVVLSTELAEIGVSRDGDRWQIVLARPRLSSELPDWGEAGRRVLERVNAARAEPRTCGEKHFSAAPPVRWDARLAQAALAHSGDMARRNYFSHTGQDGSRVAGRASRAGYAWRRVGENIAAGQGSVEQVVKGWLASPHHCANIMIPEFAEMGAAYVVNRASAATIYWTQVFGTPK